MRNAGCVRASFIFAVAALCLCSAFVFGQGVETRTRYKSPAEREAEQEVSLSAERIIALLGQEPGLLLQMKRILVRKAYEQGRILDPSDLTDDALFRLLREDDNIRVLATQEIENRSYIRAKPTREEIERERELPPPSALRTANELSSAPNRGDTRQPGAQEEAYWSTHDPEPGGIPAQPEQPWPTPPYPAPAPLPQYPAAPPNPVRQLQVTGLPENQDFYDGLGPDSASQAADSAMMTRISPEQLPNLLNASSASALHSLASDSALLGHTGRALVAPGATAPPSAPLTGPVDPFTRAVQAASQASAQFPPRPMVDLDLDRPMIAHRPNPYDDVPSLNDLYAQVSQRPAVLERFGASIFRNGTGNLDRLPMDLPAGPEYNMTDIQAAIGLHQLRKLSAMHARRREIVELYQSELAQMEEFELPVESPEVEHAWHLYVLRLHPNRLQCSRDQLIVELQRRNIGTSVHFIPLHLQPYYRDKYGFQPDDFPVARREYERMVSLPLSPRMTNQDAEDVIEALKDVAFRFRASNRVYLTSSLA